MSSAHGDHGSVDLSSQNKFMNRLVGLGKIFDGPVTFFREKFVEKNRNEYPYYHRNYPRVPTIDQCAYGDHICFFEANEQYFRDRKVDKFITQILGRRAEECYIHNGPYDGFERCRKLDEDHEKALTNYYIKCR
ncbi:NADH dehydrogenase [ubiquinone] 1 beta subcomplex subunit 10-like, partial [Brachionus plicatilis]